MMFCCKFKMHSAMIDIHFHDEGRGERKGGEEGGRGRGERKGGEEGGKGSGWDVVEGVHTPASPCSV
jgi:hypothetical protein